MYTNRLDNIFNSFFSDKFFNTPWNSRIQKKPEVNIYSSETGYELEFKTPGLNKEEVDITVEEGKLSVSSGEQENGGFKRLFELPEDADQDNISAELRDGILNVSVPKVAAAKPRKITVIGA